MVESEDYSVGEEEADSCMWMDSGSAKKGGGNDKKRRFSEEQVKSLESMFESQTKLEPRKKLQLAKELGLHPRQVAIWFQNKRARWKSKQLEREYSALRADYEALLSSFESVKTEKQSLILQLQKLAELLDKPVEKHGKDGEFNGVKEQRPSMLLTEGSDMSFVMYSDDEVKTNSRFSKREEDAYNTETPAGGGGSLISAEQQLCFQPSWPSDQSGASSQWWEFWPMNE